MPEIPSPKELLKKAAEFHDTMVELATKPIRDIAEAAGLPTPPEPPKAQDIVESLPEFPLPTPEMLLPAKKETGVEKEGMAEVSRMRTEAPKIEKKLKMKIV